MNKYPLQRTPGPRNSPHRIGSRSGTEPLDYESRHPVPNPETIPFKYFFGQLSFYLKKKTKKKKKKEKKTKKKKNEKDGSLVVSAHTGRSYYIVGFDPRDRRGNILVSQHAFFSVICRDDTK